MANIDKTRVAELAEFFSLYRQRKGVTLVQLCQDAQGRGETPARFRQNLFRAATPQSWINGLRDTTPGVSDAALDTAIRGALRQLTGASNWATSLPLKH